MATVKKATTKTVEEVVQTTETVKETKKTPRKFEATDLITVRSITQGELLMPGKKTGILYRWSAFGDITEVEYQDLYTLKASRSNFIYKPHLVIEDEELLADPKWKDVKALYDNMYTTSDIDAVFKMTAQQLKRALLKMPAGLLSAVLIEASTRIDKGTFDSINKIKAIDEACGSDLMCLIK